MRKRKVKLIFANTADHVVVLGEDVGIPGLLLTPGVGWSESEGIYTKTGSWVVTHERSGRAALRGRTKASLLRVVPSLRHCNWRQSADEIEKDMDLQAVGSRAIELMRWADFRRSGYKEKFYAVFGSDIEALAALGA